MKNREHIEWCNIWVTGADDDLGQPRLLLIGDSIANSYFSRVENDLKGRFLCARLVTSRCVSDPNFKKELTLLLDEFRFDAIHFNNGLHGWGYDEQAYTKGLSEVLDFIIAKSQRSKLILGTTTPVWQKGGPGKLDPKTARVRERNRVARKLAAEYNIPINDLFVLVIDRPELFSEDGVHFNQAGDDILGRAVAQSVLQQEVSKAEQVIT